MGEESGYDRAKEVKEFDETKVGVKGLVDAGVTTIPRFFHHSPENLASLRPISTSTEIPTIDLSDSGSLRRPEIISQIRDAAREFGFFQIVNHSIPPSVIDDTMSAVEAFHDLPGEVRAVHHARGQVRGGVTYCTNFDLLRSKAASWRDTLVLTFPVEWEQVPAICRSELREWDRRVTELGRELMGLLSEGLGLGRSKLEELGCLARTEGRGFVAHCYPYCPEPDLTMGIVSHADPGALTVLAQGPMGGLQVKYKGKWLEVKPHEGGLVINIGDLLRIMSNDEYKSAEHRVPANSHREPRISIAIFFMPGETGGPDYYGPLPELLSPEKPALYRSFTMREYLGKFFSKFFSNELGDLISNFKL